MTRNPILARFEGLLRWLQPLPRNLHVAFLRPDRLPQFVQECPPDMRVGEIRQFCKLQDEGQSLMRTAISCCA